MPKADKTRALPRQERSKATVAAVIEAAAQLLVETGPGVSTNAIAARAGVGIASLYRYFPNKAALFQAVAEEYGQYLEARADQLVAEVESTSPREAINRFILWVAETENGWHPGLGSVLNSMRRHGAHFPAMEAFEAGVEERAVAIFPPLSAHAGPRAEQLTRLVARSVIGLVKTTLANGSSEVSTAAFKRLLKYIASGALRPAVETSQRVDGRHTDQTKSEPSPSGTAGLDSETPPNSGLSRNESPPDGA